VGENVTYNKATPTHMRKGTLFRFNSPGFNRSKYLALYTLRELESKGNSTCFNVLYVNSAVCYRGLICALPRWIEWKYIHLVWKEGNKEYRISYKGRRFLDKLDRIIPNTVDQWLAELDEWRGILPEPIDDWSRPALVKLLEPMRYHRQGHPGKKKPKTRPEIKQEVKACKWCGGTLISCQYEGQPAEYCGKCNMVNFLITARENGSEVMA
jgi:hypothetical protein